MQKNETGPVFTKINSKWIKDFDSGPETIKLIDESMGSKLFDLLAMIFFGPDTKNKSNKSENKQVEKWKWALH